MATLALFLGLIAATIWAAWRLRERFELLRKIGLGGAEEDLERARRTIGASAINFVALLAVAAATIAIGERWAPEWRGATAGAWALQALAVIMGVLTVWTFGYSVRQQWSAKGTFGGMMLGGMGFVISAGLLMLLMHWRFG